MSRKIRKKEPPLIELMKPRISIMVLVTAYLGFYLGLRSKGLHMLQFSSWLALVNLLIGTFLSSSGAAVLNQVIEWRADAKMKRTMKRPIPAGEISPVNAALFGIALSLFGIGYLVFTTNGLTALLSLSTIILYLAVYTPLKRVTTWNTLVGSVPGAIPPLGGWAAATGTLDAPAWLLFGVLFCWQIPHFLAIAIIYAQDYNRGGFKMLPSEYPASRYTSYHILFFTIALLGTSIGLFILKIAGLIYAIGAGILGLVFLYYGFRVMKKPSNQNARQLMFASIIYLPILLLLIILD